MIALDDVTVHLLAVYYLTKVRGPVNFDMVADFLL